MEKAWPPVSESYQFKIGLIRRALCRYPWEDADTFDFNNYYPPIPVELASLRKLLDYLTKIGFRLSSPEDIQYCPFCRLHPNPNPQDDQIPSGSGIPTLPAWRVERIPMHVDILNDPVWDMDPIPCPLHLMKHVWPDGSGPRLVTPQHLEDTKKYINQVRNSRGYDVDCIPHHVLVGSDFWKVDLTSKSGRHTKDFLMRKLGSSAIAHINMKSGKVYELEDILKIVSTRVRVYLITFTAKVKDDVSAASDTFVATIDPHHPCPSNAYLKECLLKPDYNAPGPDHYPDFVVHPIQVSHFVMRRRTAVPAHVGPYHLLGSEKRSQSTEPGPTVSKRSRTNTEAETSPEVPFPDCQCKVAEGWKASSQAKLKWKSEAHSPAVEAEPLQTLSPDIPASKY